MTRLCSTPILVGRLALLRDLTFKGRLGTGVLVGADRQRPRRLASFPSPNPTRPCHACIGNVGRARDRISKMRSLVFVWGTQYTTDPENPQSSLALRSRSRRPPRSASPEQDGERKAGISGELSDPSSPAMVRYLTSKLRLDRAAVSFGQQPIASWSPSQSELHSLVAGQG